MSITVSGLGSGLDYDTWIQELVAIKQADIDAVSSQVTTIQKKESSLSSLKSDYTSLLDAIQTFTNALSSDDVFNQKTATSSSDAVSAKVDSSASAQTVKVTVSQLATATTAESASTAASYVDSSTKIGDISEGGIKAGTFSVYVDGSKSSINITSDESMQDVLDDLNAVSGVSASISNDGKLSITSSSSGHTVTVGSSSDTSNFSNVMSLSRDSKTGAYSSSKSIFDTNTSTALTSTSFANGTVKAGTFTIGDTEFTIDSDTSLDDLISKINSSTAGVTAAWDSNSGKLVLTSNDEGAANINIEAGTSNFTDVMGLTTSTWNEDGSMATTSLATGSQTLGTDAILTINGTTITSSSNTVTSDISGLTGVTLTLNDTTSSTAKVSVTQDTSKVSDAITTFVNDLNAVIKDTDSATSSSGNLYGESILTSLRNSIRTLATASVGGTGTYKTLGSIGISTGAIGSTTISDDTDQLSIDTDTLTAALTNNPDAVKSLLLGDSTTGTKGVLSNIETVVKNATTSKTGFFDEKESTYESQVKRLNDKITTMNTALDDYKTQLEKKFSAMDELISNLQNQASVFDSYFNSSSSSS